MARKKIRHRKYGLRYGKTRTIRHPKTLKRLHAKIRRHAKAKLSPAKRRLIARKIRILMHEGRPQKQAIAIAFRMAGVPKKRARHKGRR